MKENLVANKAQEERVFVLVRTRYFLKFPNAVLMPPAKKIPPPIHATLVLFI